MSQIAEVFLACDAAIDRGVPLRSPDAGAGAAGSPFQNWFDDCLRHAGVGAELRGSRSFPDFVLNETPEGFELKGLEVPGRFRDFDANSQFPKGSHGGRDIYYVFGRYDKAAVQRREGVRDLAIVHGDLISLTAESIHKNTNAAGAGSFGDVKIRIRKMYVPPTPYGILDGTIGERTLVVPEAHAEACRAHPRLREVGTVTRTVAERSITRIITDLRSPGLEVETEPKAGAGTACAFVAFRSAEGSTTPVRLADALSEAPSTVEIDDIGRDE